MGSVIEQTRLPRDKKVYLLLFAIYFIAGFAFLTIGLQPAKNSAEVYAAESEKATAYLDIPGISLNTPVVEVELNGSNLEVPEQIAGSYSAHKNKTLIIGHSSTIFKNLQHLSPGQELSYNGHSYTITAISEKEKNTISMKEILQEEERKTIVLMTCSGDLIEGSNGDHTHRLIVTAVVKS